MEQYAFIKPGGEKRGLQLEGNTKVKRKNHFNAFGFDFFFFFWKIYRVSREADRSGIGESCGSAIPSFPEGNKAGSTGSGGGMESVDFRTLAMRKGRMRGLGEKKSIN